mmetsp:Transcript_87153/g.144958  ORF Transcript_87153/g.144958 Transcript_87153/m.144958 type:complete len:231 (-) Transcript_87153:2820-3512(-)
MSVEAQAVGDDADGVRGRHQNGLQHRRCQADVRGPGRRGVPGHHVPSPDLLGEAQPAVVRPELHLRYAHHVPPRRRVLQCSGLRLPRVGLHLPRHVRYVRGRCHAGGGGAVRVRRFRGPVVVGFQGLQDHAHRDVRGVGRLGRMQQALWWWGEQAADQCAVRRPVPPEDAEGVQRPSLHLRFQPKRLEAHLPSLMRWYRTVPEVRRQMPGRLRRRTLGVLWSGRALDEIR